ncbi:efflux RND transporter periplasmic adaptor subunit [Luteolibacter sp. SL250]|uniref:efflux RND transporter periplasmic adaptor subunit n=1 Tax=Luteolibacter sp. SL250 TaxID=2995170 RepID=UPI00226FB0B8|nr:efflux RND transporter periplasmic adaptor subunit [Luteolibacter sp. SL250]WAC18996.1 efflux RND transporter periplasmic adaptor subunit [Luteolibacter sp. SL250]
MKKRWIILLLLLAGIAAAAVWKKSSPAKGTAAAGKPAAPRAAAVVVGKVRRGDVPIWFTGIGNVQASNTVTVRPRVGGALEKIHFTEGALVKEGDVIAEIDPRPYAAALAQAEAKKVQDEATLANARLEETRFAGLLANDAVSKQQADQAAAAVSQLEALVKADDAAIDAAKLDLEFTKVRAPITGTTGIRLVDAGNLVTANQTTGLVVITAVQPINVIFTLPQKNLSALSAATRGGTPKPRVEAVGDDGKTLGEGSLELIDNQIDTTTGTLKLKAGFPNADLALWPGQFVTARILVETRRDVLLVPTEAIQPGIDGRFCYVVKEDGTVEPRVVKAGISHGQDTVIEEGLIAGDTIVTTGQSKLSPGMKVAPKEAKAP